MSARTRTAALVATLLVTLAGVVLVAAPDRPVPDQNQRAGLVSTAQMFEDTDTHYPTGAEYAQAVYASQGIDISTDIAADSYVSDTGPMVGDIVDGHGYVGILVSEGIAVGVPDDGGAAQVMRLTTEDIRRVDW